MSKSLITVTKAAQTHLKTILEKSGKPAIFFDIKSGGCSGFEYRFKPIDTIENKQNLYEKDGLKIEVCDKSLLYLLGTEIDWKDDIMGQAFKFDNPMSKASCGCGTSFTPF